MKPHFPSADAYSNEPIRYAALQVFDIAAEQRAVTTDYSNTVLTRMNSTCLRLAVFHGEYRWHHHPNSDELFLVLEGRLEIDLPNGQRLGLDPLQAIVVAAGIVHRTRAVGRTVNLTFEGLATETVFVD